MRFDLLTVTQQLATLAVGRPSVAWLAICLMLAGCGGPSSSQTPPAQYDNDSTAASGSQTALPAAGDRQSADVGTSAIADQPIAQLVPDTPPTEEITDLDLWPDLDRWPLGRGSQRATGVAASALPDKPELVWKVSPPDAAFESTPVIYDGMVYIGCLNGYLYALNLADGSEKWKFKTELGFYAAPAFRKGLLYIGDAEGRFYCLNADTGEVQWGPFAAQAEIDSGANFHHDRVLFGSQDSNLYCLDAEQGTLVWKFAIADQIRCFPTVVGDRSFVAGCDSKFHIVDLKTGTEVGSVDIEAPTGAAPAVRGDLVFFGTEGESVFCINWRQAQVVWKYRDAKKHMPFRSSAALTKNLVLIGGRDKLLHALDDKTGQQLWSFVTQSRVDSSPVVVGDRIFFGSSDGRVYCLDLKGNKVWEYEAGGGFSGSPAVASQRLVIANENGTVYCFGKK